MPSLNGNADLALQLEQFQQAQQRWEQEHQQLEQELAQAQQLTHHHVKRVTHLEQALDQAMTCLEELRQQLQEQEMLEAQLAVTEEFANVQQQAIVRLKYQLSQETGGMVDSDGTDLSCAASSANRGPAASELEQTLLTAQAQIKALSQEVEDRATLQARLQHTCQELTTERDSLQSRMSTLEQQNAELQEQILKQVKQISDYETGVQHWKDRYLMAQQKTAQLSFLLESLLAGQRLETINATELEQMLIEGLKVAQSDDREGEIPTPDTVNLLDASARIAADVNIPEFLLRRRRSSNL